MRQVLDQIQEGDNMEHRLLKFDLVDGPADKFDIAFCQKFSCHMRWFDAVFFIPTWKHPQEIASKTPDVKNTTRRKRVPDCLGRKFEVRALLPLPEVRRRQAVLLDQFGGREEGVTENQAANPAPIEFSRIGEPDDSNSISNLSKAHRSLGFA